MADTPLTLAETASVFGEMLTFRAMLAAETEPRRRKAMLAGKVEDMLNTVVRQIAFVTFEIRVHDERREGELTPERIGEIWLDVQRESLGPAIGFEDEYRWYWTYIPHFIHTPFYVYAYAFGDCLVNSLYAVYQGAEAGFAAEISRHAARRRQQAAQGALGAVRARRVRPEFLEEGPLGGRRLHRRARGDGLIRWPTMTRFPAGCGATPASRRRWAGSRRGSRERAISACRSTGRATRRPQGGAGRHQGAADEGGAASRHHPQRAAGGIRQRAGHAPGERAADGLVLRAPPHGRRAGPDWQQKFRSFEHEAARAASLGQVHRAVAKDGRALACKLQYPDMDSAVEADLTQLKLVLSLYERYDRAVTTDEIHAEVADRLREELDYARELAHMRLYRIMLADEPAVFVPEPLPELSTRRLLTMTWLEGVPLLDAVKEPLAARNEIARNMFRTWYVPLYYYGVIHGDPHLGNYTVRTDRGINLMDFGCIRIFPAAFVKGVIDLYHALDRDDEALAVAAYESWGFKKLSATSSTC